MQRDTVITRLAENFRQQDETFLTQDEKQKFRKQWVGQVSGEFGTVQDGFTALGGVSKLIGEDLTAFHPSQLVDLPASVPSEQAKKLIADSRQDVSLFRKGMSSALGALEWWQENAVEPSAALVMASAFALTPGEQDFEKRMRTAAAEIRSQEGADLRSDILTTARAATKAYRNTNTTWGTKGLLELVFDPLNLIGLGLPGVGATLARKAGMRALIRPLQIANAIDNAPNAAVGALLGLPLKGIRKIPGVKGLTERHWSTMVRETFVQTHAAFGEAFGQAGIRFLDGTADDTKRFLAEMKPEVFSGSPRSSANLMNHIEDSIEGVVNTHDILDTLPARFESATAAFDKVIDNFTGSADKLKAQVDTWRDSTPAEFAVDVAKKVQTIERKNILAANRTGRIEKIQGILQKMRDDERWAKGLATGIDGFLLRKENQYINTIEPLLVRPWAVAHLAFAGFPIMNVVEEIGASALGLGINIFGVNDKMYRHITANLFGDALPPTQLSFAGRDANDLLVNATGLFNDAPAKKIENILSLGTNKLFVETGSKVSRGIQRKAWTGFYLKAFNKQLRNQGVDDATIDALSSIVKSETPLGLSKSITRDIQAKAWVAMTTGDSTAIAALKETATATDYMVRHQMEILSDKLELPTDVRRRLRAFIASEGGITRETLPTIRENIREELFKWSRYTPEGVRATVLPFFDALGKVPPRDTVNALNSLRMIQHAADELNLLSKEIMADAKHRVRMAPPNKRDGIWEEAFKRDAEITEELQGAFSEALTRTNNPEFQKLLTDVAPREAKGIRLNVDEIFEEYRGISEINLKTRQELSKKREVHFSNADRDDAFYSEWDNITDEAWGLNRIDVAERSYNARRGWNEIFSNLDIHSRSPVDQRAMKTGMQALLGEVDGSLSQLVNDLQQWEGLLAFATPGVRPSIDGKLLQIKSLIQKEKGLRNTYQAKLKELDSAVSEFKTPAALREYDTEARRMNLAIKEAEAKGIPTADLQVELQTLSQERLTMFNEIVPDHMRDQWASFGTDLSALQSKLSVFANNPKLAQGTRGEIKRKQAEMKRFMKRVESGDAHREALEITNTVQDERVKIAKQILRANDGAIPSDMNRMEDIWRQGMETGAVARPSDELTREMLNPESLANIYSQVVDNAVPPALTLREQALLRDIQVLGDVPTSGEFVSLLERGVIGAPKNLKNGMWRAEITDDGLKLLDDVPDVIDTEALLADLPDYVREYDTVIDAQVATLDDVFDKMLKISDNPPVTVEQQGQIGNYFDRVGKQMENVPGFADAAKAARIDAAKDTNVEFRKFFIDYDQRTTGDFIMQRLMPFWMYESRRWPRLIALAAKHPVMAKHFTLLGGEWDYGYQPLPWGGMEFNPAKGTIVGGLRRTLSRDFPEMHSGYRGQVEESLDWLGRFGFYFAPPITTGVNLLNGEIAGNLPAPLTSLLYAAGSFTNLPAGLEEIAFQSRFVDFLVDTAIVDVLGKSATDVRAAASAGDDEAIASLFLAKREAAKRLFAITQTGVLRYRPEVVRDFKGDVADAVEQFAGLDKSDLKDLERLGVPYWSVIPVSGFQRKAIREAVGEDAYNVLVSRSISLRPIEEQKALRQVDEFWRRHEQVQNAFETEMLLLDNKYTEGEISGPQARRGYKDVLSRRAFAFDTIKNDERFADVPVTMQEKLEWTKRFNNPPPLVHPIDELQEAYYSISPDNYLDPTTNETNWNQFYIARDTLLQQWQKAGPGAATAVDIFTRSLMKADTRLERNLKVSADKLRDYFSVSSKLLVNLDATRPEAGIAYREYRKALNLSAQAVSPRDKRNLDDQARKLTIAFPQIPMLDMLARKQREQMRTTDPEMARVYAVWISNPS